MCKLSIKQIIGGNMGKLIERQVIATWYTPMEKLPPAEWDTLLLTVSGKGNNVAYDHALALGGYDPEIGWYLDGLEDELLNDFTVHAWCDIYPYRG